MGQELEKTDFKEFNYMTCFCFDPTNYLFLPVRHFLAAMENEPDPASWGRGRCYFQHLYNIIWSTDEKSSRRGRCLLESQVRVRLNLCRNVGSFVLAKSYGV